MAKSSKAFMMQGRCRVHTESSNKSQDRSLIAKRRVVVDEHGDCRPILGPGATKMVNHSWKAKTPPGQMQKEPLGLGEKFEAAVALALPLVQDIQPHHIAASVEVIGGRQPEGVELFRRDGAGDKSSTLNSGESAAVAADRLMKKKVGSQPVPHDGPLLCARRRVQGLAVGGVLTAAAAAE